MRELKRKPKKSLRNLLIIWFILFSVLPLVFVTFYSLFKFEKAIDNELTQRLSGNGRELNTRIQDIRSSLVRNRDKYLLDSTLKAGVLSGDSASLDSWSQQAVRVDQVKSISVFNHEGRLLTSSTRDDRYGIRSYTNNQEVVFLAAKYISDLSDKGDTESIEFSGTRGIRLILLSKMVSGNQKTIGYIEQVFVLDREFLQKMKASLKSDLILFSDSFEPILSTQNDLLLYRPSTYKKVLADKTIFNLKLRGDPMGFLGYPIGWGEYRIYTAIGSSKAEANSVLQNINIAFISVVAVVTILLLTTIILTSNWFLKPIYYLVDALQSFEIQEQAATIPVRDSTEIGLLTESFNEMSRKISQARLELEGKVKELELANLELRDTQTKLVHSAKMISLGQLVAGVAHELNNPIGFIYSNMKHLKEYSQGLISAVHLAQQDPSKQLEQHLNEIEFDYIINDLPKLIQSCEDGSRRVRDIVVGLRNFSRLEESKLQEVDIQQSIESTLDLLHGEIKSRLQIHKSYSGPTKIFGYASQINQVLMNILSNAVQAIEGPGQIWITTSNLDSHRNLRQDLRLGGVVISVQDSGKGMPAEIVDKIFDPFFTTKGVGQGTGLGLSISYGIVENHGGEIRVKSQVGIGTEFLIFLPLKAKVSDADENSALS